MGSGIGYLIRLFGLVLLSFIPYQNLLIFVDKYVIILG